MADEKKDAAPAKPKRLVANVILTDPQTQDAVTFGPGHVDAASGREVYAFTINGEPADELPGWAREAITNPKAWA